MENFMKYYCILLVVSSIFFVGCSKTVEGVKQDSSKAWEATKEGTTKAWQSTKKGIHEATE